MKSIDIASYQQNVDFVKVKNSGIEIVYIKAMEGITYNNPLLEPQYRGAIAVGLKIGFYHYLRAIYGYKLLEEKHDVPNYFFPIILFNLQALLKINSVNCPVVYL